MRQPYRDAAAAPPIRRVAAMPPMNRSSIASAVRVDLALRHPPARKVTVDIHARKAVDQGPAGDLHPLQVGAELALRGASASMRPVMPISFGIVARHLGRAVVIEMPAARDGLEMRGVTQRPAQIGGRSSADAPAGRRRAPRQARSRSRRETAAALPRPPPSSGRRGYRSAGTARPADTPARRAASRTLTASGPPSSTSWSAASISARRRSPW